MRLKITADKCTGCRSCEIACSLAHEGTCSPDRGRVWIDFAEHDTKFAPKICRQCRRPRCAAACLAGALEALPEGGVRLIPERCTKCGSCASACPFGYLRLSPNGMPLVCDLCAGRPDGPACARICQEGAIIAAGSPGHGSVEWSRRSGTSEREQ
ncbi:MAG: 4Fe-4S dicluster domain-containing protein [Bacteroidota bacterium]